MQGSLVDYSSSDEEAKTRVGYWPVHIYLRVESDSLQKIFAQMKVIQPGLSSIYPIHISLSKTVELTFDQITEFTQKFNDLKREFDCVAVSFGRIATYTNEMRTRHFLSLDVEEGVRELCELLEKVNSLMNEFRLSLFYDPPSFHCSLAWSDKQFVKDFSCIQIPKGKILLTNLECLLGNKVL